MGDTWLLKRLGQPKITLPLDLQPSIISPLSGVLIGQTAARSARAIQFTRSSGGNIAFLIYRDIHLFCCCVLCLRQVSHCSSDWLGTHSCSLEFAAILPWSPTDMSHHIHPVTPGTLLGSFLMGSMQMQDIPVFIYVHTLSYSIWCARLWVKCLPFCLCLQS